MVYADAVQAGLFWLDIDTAVFLNDRIVYDSKVFRVAAIEVLGQIQRRDIVVGIDATQIKPDQLVNDPQFKPYSA